MRLSLQDEIDYQENNNIYIFGKNYDDYGIISKNLDNSLYNHTIDSFKSPTKPDGRTSAALSFDSGELFYALHNATLCYDEIEHWIYIEDTFDFTEWLVSQDIDEYSNPASWANDIACCDQNIGVIHPCKFRIYIKKIEIE